MTENQPIQPNQPRTTNLSPTPTNTFFRMWTEFLESMASTEQFLRNPVGRTASSRGRVEDDEWSDENMRRWEEADKLDPELAEWLRTLPRK